MPTLRDHPVAAEDERDGLVGQHGPRVELLGGQVPLHAVAAARDGAGDEGRPRSLADAHVQEVGVVEPPRPRAGVPPGDPLAHGHQIGLVLVRALALHDRGRVEAGGHVVQVAPATPAAGRRARCAAGGGRPCAARPSSSGSRA